MRPTSPRSFRRMLRIATAALAALVLSAGVFAPTADAHGKPKKHHKQRHEQHHRHVYDHTADRHGHAHFVVPQRIRGGHVARFESYHSGRIWYAPHRHYHAVYQFPVVAGYGVAYVPHAYCGETLYATGHLAVAGPRFGLYIGF